MTGDIDTFFKVEGPKFHLTHQNHEGLPIQRKRQVKCSKKYVELIGSNLA